MLRKNLTTTAILLAAFTPLFAQDSTKNNTSIVPIPMPPSAMAGYSPMATPGMAGPLQANPRPFGYNLGHFGNIYVTGIVSGIGKWQTNVFPGDHSSIIDLSNGQIFIQKVDGVIQFFVQAGAYSLPDIGLPYIRAGNTETATGIATNAFYGVVPQAFLKIAPTKNFSLMAGKLPTLVGAEYTFSFENMNIERGLFWNQENAVNRGVQANFTAGPVTFAASWNDGMYSNRYTWAWLSAVYTINSKNTLAIVGGGNTKTSTFSSSATPLYLNNEQIYNLIYTHTSGKWTIEPYLQYTSVPKKDELKTTDDAKTYGAALFVNYAALSNPDASSFFLPVRIEYKSSTGSLNAANLLYGQGSNAWSFTLTPTYQYKRLFARAEFSLVKANKIISGAAFGPAGNNSTQSHLSLEVGLFF
ncbi:MAG TPA: outer membrane beta-barrel protein [Chitinophagaceae bacterium]|nr:outer membrane beta-barrel protein [Chitinophagaceae bacterium]